MYDDLPQKKLEVTEYREHFSHRQQHRGVGHNLVPRFRSCASILGQGRWSLTDQVELLPLLNVTVTY